MEVRCKNCNAKINISEEKIPEGQTFSFNCPSCKGKVTVSQAKVPEAATGGEREAQVFRADSTQPGAMICHTDSAQLKELAEKLGYQVHVPGSHLEAARNLRFNDYRLIIITDDFEKVPHDGSSILQTLQNTAMDKRRKTFVLYIGPDVKTFDTMKAFSISVNAMIASDDFASKGDDYIEPLKRAIFENELAYKVFFETMAATGKS